MLTQLNQAHGGKLFELIAGLVIGDVGDVVTKGNSQVDVDTSEWYWLKQFGLPKDLPVLIELPIGHITDARVAALGANGRLDLNGQTLIVGFRDLL